MKEKYLILDFGKVIAGPTTGSWLLTKKFYELIDMTKFNIDKFDFACNSYGSILSLKITTLEEEYAMLQDFYKYILVACDYTNIDMDVVAKIAYDRVYKNDKYTLYDGVYEELTMLKEKYTLIMLTDNLPSVIPYLKTYNLYKFFTKVYVSSVYGLEKRNGAFFDFPIKDFNISVGEAIFVDDNEKLLDIAVQKGLDVRLMDRNKSVDKSKYKIINNLFSV